MPDTESTATGERTRYLSIEVLCQLLNEAPVVVIEELLGFGYEAIINLRRRYGAPDPWQGYNRQQRVGIAKVVRRRWRDYPDHIPDPIDHAALRRLVEQELNPSTSVERKTNARPITVGRIIVEVRNYHKQYKCWPTFNELERCLGDAPGLRNALRLANQQSMIDSTGGIIRPHEIAQANVVTYSTMTTEDIAKYGPPRNPVEAQRIRDHIVGILCNGGSTQNVDPEKAVRDAERATISTYAPGSQGQYKEVAQ